MGNPDGMVQETDGNMIGILERGLDCKFRLKIHQQMVIIETQWSSNFCLHIP